MNLNEYYTEKEVLDLLSLSLYDLKKIRSQLSIKKVGRKYWYDKASIRDWALENISDTTKYEQTKRQVDSQAIEVSTEDWLPVNEVYNCWPYSRERLSQNARTSKNKIPSISRFKANKHWFYDKSGIKRWLLNHKENVRDSKAYLRTENGTQYKSYEEWLKAVEQW